MVDPGCVQIRCLVRTCEETDGGFYSYAVAVYEHYSDNGVPLKLTVVAEAGCDATCCNPYLPSVCDEKECCATKIVSGYGRVTARAECYASPFYYWADLCVAIPTCGSCDCYY